MLRLPRFDYLAPRSVAEATSMLEAHGPRAMLVAGGTDLFPNMKRRQQEPAVVIGLRSIAALRGIQPMHGGVHLGAMATLHEVATHPLVRQRCPALATAAGLVSTPSRRRSSSTVASWNRRAWCSERSARHPSINPAPPNRSLAVGPRLKRSGRWQRWPTKARDRSTTLT